MRNDYSSPVLTARPTRSAFPGRREIRSGEPEEDKQVDYSHLDVIAEVERIIERRLVRHTRTSGKYHCACPFPDCTSKQDAFTVWDRPVLDERGNGRREVHFWCGRCGRTGSLISLIRQYREAMTGEQVSWAKAARELRIDPRTWRAMDESDQNPGRRATASETRRHQAELQRRAEQAELATLDALYHRARAWLAAGQVTMRDGRQIPLEQARAYLRARGYTLDQAMQIRLAYIPTVQEVPELAHLVARSWRGRILFPLSGPKGASGYAGRTLWHWTSGMTAEQHKHLLETWNEQHPDQRVARHYKTRQPAYYGYDEACRASTLVIVEGEFDAASCRLALADMPDIAVCAFGKQVQARLVPVKVLHVVLALDLDHAGLQAIACLTDALQARGMTVSVATPPAGKDWNDCHVLAGLEAIRAEIVRALVVSPLATMPEQEAITVDETRPPRPVEPAGYERGDICLICGKPIDPTEGAFFVCEDRTSVYYGDLFCTPCWTRQHSPLHMEQVETTGVTVPESLDHHAPTPEILDRQERHNQEQDARSALMAKEDLETPDELEHDRSNQDQPFTTANSRCPRHHRPWRYSDELGERYCDHVDCWERYRLIRLGAARGYPALSGVVDPRDYLPDTSKAPLYHTASGLPVYPARPAISQPLISAGTDAWHDYAVGRTYHDIDQAIKALLRKGQNSG